MEMVSFMPGHLTPRKNVPKAHYTKDVKLTSELSQLI
jgi:hypothetical protein